jgi:hypothetical protein
METDIARPVIAMPVFYTRAATVYEREIWKLEKETFEKFDEAETNIARRHCCEPFSGHYPHDQHPTRRRHIINDCPPAGGGDAHTVQHAPPPYRTSLQWRTTLNALSLTSKIS